MSSLDGAKIAIVHDWLVTSGGAELVLDSMLDVFPQAAVFALIASDEQRRRVSGDEQRPRISGDGDRRSAGVHTSWLQHVPGVLQRYRSFLPVMPLAMRSLDVSGFDIVISNSHAVAKGVRTHAPSNPEQLHLCYCLSPMRYAWDLKAQYLHEAGLDRGVKGALASAMLERMRQWDLANASGVDAFVTLSSYIAERIERAYGRAAEVVYPPVDTDFFVPPESAGGAREGAFLHGTARRDVYVTASRFVPYKRIDMIARAFRLLPDRTLVIIGDGPDREKVRAVAGPNVQLAGRLPREELRAQLQHARAFVFAAEEDFGIAPVEAQACGTPVIAYGRGGVCETIRGLDAAEPTGVLYDEQSAEGLARAVRAFEAHTPAIRADACRRNALRFRAELFREGIRGAVARADAARRAV